MRLSVTTMDWVQTLVPCLNAFLLLVLGTVYYRRLVTMQGAFDRHRAHLEQELDELRGRVRLTENNLPALEVERPEGG